MGPPRASYNELSIDTKRKKASALSRLIDLATKCAAPDNPEDFKQSSLNKLLPPKSKMEETAAYKNLLKNIAQLYVMAESKIEKLQVLSLVTTILPFKSVQVSFYKQYSNYFILTGNNTRSYSLYVPKVSENCSTS